MATIRKRKSKWQVQVRRKDCRATSKTFTLRADAESWARQMDVQADRDELPHLDKSLSKVTLREILVRYRDSIAIKKISYQSEKCLIDVFLRQNFVDKPINNIKQSEFIEYREFRLIQVKAASYNREIGIIQHAYKVAKTEWGLPIKNNPLDSLKKPKVRNARQRRLKPGEFEQLENKRHLTINPYVWPIVCLAIETGMRRKEIVGIKSEHLDVDSKTLEIPYTKTGYPRRIPLSPKAFHILCSHLQNSSGRLFPITTNSLRLAWERLLKRTNISGLTFHDLRHEAVSRLFEQGLSVPEVALISGHRDYRMLMRYTHIKPEDIVAKLT